MSIISRKQHVLSNKSEIIDPQLIQKQIITKSLRKTKQKFYQKLPKKWKKKLSGIIEEIKEKTINYF